MEVEESGTALSERPQTRIRRRTKKKGASRRKGTSLRAPAGSFCGPLIGQSATFYSTGDTVKLTVFVPPQGAAGQPVVPRLYLTYRFLNHNEEHSAFVPNKSTGGTKCDTMLTNCHFKECVIRSPNFPGFYLRNISCHYWVRQDSAPPGKIAQIEIYQDNEFKINIPSGHSNSDRYKPGTLTSDCAGDVVKVFDGRTIESPLLVEFCGAGPLPTIRSSGPDILVKLVSVPSQTLANSHFELTVRIHFAKASETFRVASEGCSVTVDGARHPVGIFQSPDHSVPSGTTCTYRVVGKHPTDLIWLYFSSYHVPDLNPWTDHENCDVGKLEIMQPIPRVRHAHHDYHIYHSFSPVVLRDTFCEKRSPKQCGHASDFADLIPSRPCTVPDESYLSPGPEVILKMTFLSSTAIRGNGGPHFTARYEIVETTPYKEDVLSNPCVINVNSRESPKGTLDSPRNVFLYGRGGARDLVCKYELRGTPDLRVRLKVHDIYFSSSALCQTTYDAVVERQKCNVYHFGKFALINVTELWQDSTVFVGCVCDSSQSFVLESLGHMMDIGFLVRNMGPRDDFQTFRFSLEYEFVPVTSVCETTQVTGMNVMSGSKGKLALSIHNVLPFRCRWLLAALPSRALYLTVKGRTFDTECRNKILFYNTNNWEPFKVFCPSENDHYESFFTESWKPDPYRSIEADLTFLEYIFNEPGQFEVNWIEVTRPKSKPCSLECPELEACIGEDLACDGIRHCPVSGNDETPERCNQLPLLTIAISSTAAVAFVTLLVLGVLLRYKLVKSKDKTVIPPPDMYRNDCKHTFSNKAPVR
ncbi:CUB domain-containing protein [Trichonephila clavipes]|nr:CUB domain-containing protein [Trichonephila clavipes]